jgi:hypothetical protein
VWYYAALYVASLLLAYTMNRHQAVYLMGRAITKGSAEGSNLMYTSVESPAYAFFFFTVYGLCFLVVVFGFYRFGFLGGIGRAFGLLMLAVVNSTVVLPKPGSSLYRKHILRSMVKRYERYVQKGDRRRARAMAELRRMAGIPIDPAEYEKLWQLP